jgi:hypothetical protein
MIRLLSLILVSLSILNSAAYAEGSKFGLGFVIGDPVSITAKFIQNPETAYDLQFSISSREYVLFYGDFLFQFPALFGRSVKFVENLTPYVGFGPLVALPSKSDHAQGQYFDRRDDKYALGARIPVGVEWIWDRAPLGVGVELVPGVIVAPATTGILQGGISLRYYF